MHFRFNRAQAVDITSKLWLDLVDAGEIWFPQRVTGIRGKDGEGTAQMLTFALRKLRDRDSITCFIDTHDGDQDSFDGPAVELLARRNRGQQTIGHVVGEAISIGITYIAVCTRRIARPDADFLMHGEFCIQGERMPDGTYWQDHYIADWLQRFTPRTREEWLATVQGGHRIRFDAKQALAWGVIDEIEQVV